ncbi:hypothetical protein BDY19DRAFT_271775 [Irpex rosettiformis]|uniref:Uncharacterized protein n=1 Tax=Irpex rosettiformis TaxID=378272 RepID=A0ACB8UH30_9APHY|nr:hypothetical protein BDY19DRAFT_271775 [Irpex rosettiformis]
MGSVKTAASVGNNKYSRVQGSAALGSTEGAGWDKGSRGRPPTNDDDDGGGMAWVRRRKEERERAKREAAEKAAAEVAAHESQAEVTEAPKDEHAEEKPHAEVADPDPPVTTTVEQVEETQIKTVEPEERSTPIAVTENAEHVTTAVKIPAHTPSPRHHSISLGHHPNGHPMRLSTERTPSFASRHSIPRPPERRSSADTARAVSPVSQDVLTDAQEIVGELEGLEEQREEEVETVRERRQSGSSTGTASEDEDADAEYSPKEEDEEEDEEELTSKTAHALGAGVEKISRHKPNHSQDGVISPGA